MKLAEALLLRADLLKKSASLRERVVANAVVQENEEPHESPKELLEAAFDVIEQHAALMLRIHRTNLAAKLSDGRSLTEVLARRDALAQQHSLLIAAIAGCRKEPERYSVREIKWVATLKVPKLQRQADDLAKQLRELNARIQEANWQVELAD